jgi:hypothetical protein
MLVRPVLYHLKLTPAKKIPDSKFGSNIFFPPKVVHESNQTYSRLFQLLGCDSDLSSHADWRENNV